MILRVDWRGEEIDRLLDRAHSALIDWIVRELVRFGWQVETEVTFDIRGERGSIDVFACVPIARIALVVEVKSAFGDLQATLMILDRKVRLAPVVARRFGWPVGQVARLLVVGEGRSARRVLEARKALFETAFPLRGRAAARWLRSATIEPFSGLVFSSAASRESVTRRRRVRRTAQEHSRTPMNSRGDRGSHLCVLFGPSLRRNASQVSR